MKNYFLNKTGCGFILTILFITTGLTSCLKEEWQNCHNRLRFVYDYNMDRMDKFCGQVKYMSIFAFDSETGLFKDEFVVQISGESNFSMSVPLSLHDKKYDLYVWAGLNPDSYLFPQLQKGISKAEELEVQVHGYEKMLVDCQLEPLWHGKLLGVEFFRIGEKTETVYMIKDTNTFNVVVTFVDNISRATTPYDLEDLEVCITAPNGWIAYDNNMLDDMDRYLEHVPYISRIEDENLTYEMNSLRLMEERNHTLTIRQKSTGKALYKMDLNRYLKLLMQDQHKWIESLQEYYDREDSFKFIIAVDNGGGENENGWLSVKVKINEWVVREHNIN